MDSFCQTAINFEGMEPGFPLVSVAFNLHKEVVNKADDDSLETAEQIFLEYSLGKIDYEEAVTKYTQISTNVSPLKKIYDILLTAKDPIPASPADSMEDMNSHRKKTRPWTTPEDNRLYMGVFKYGTDSWTSVAQFVGFGRNRSQCSQRWVRGIDPKVSKSHWTPEEEEKLAKIVSQLGTKSWMKVASELGYRSDVQCRYRWFQIERQMQERGVISTDNTKTPSDSNSSYLMSSGEEYIRMGDIAHSIGIEQQISLSETTFSFRSDSLFDSQTCVF